MNEYMELIAKSSDLVKPKNEFIEYIIRNYGDKKYHLNQFEKDYFAYSNWKKKEV